MGVHRVAALVALALLEASGCASVATPRSPHVGRNEAIEQSTPGAQLCAAVRAAGRTAHAHERRDLPSGANERDRARQAGRRFEAEVQRYRALLAERPNAPEAEGLRYRLGEALYGAGAFEEAVCTFSEVRPALQEELHPWVVSAMVVLSLEALIRERVREGTFDPCLAARAGLPVDELTDEHGAARLSAEQTSNCTGPPMSAGAIVRIDMPPLVLELIGARDVSRADLGCESDLPLIARDRCSARPSERLQIARTALRFGQAEWAESLYREFLRRADLVSAEGRSAMQELANLLWLGDRRRDLSSIVRELRRRVCDERERWIAEVDTIVINAPFRRALELFRQAERAPAADATELYRRAASVMESAIRMNLNRRDVALAHYYVGLADERVGNTERALTTFLFITQSYPPLPDADGSAPCDDAPERRASLLEASTLRAALCAERLARFDQAVPLFRAVVADPRFATSIDHEVNVREAAAAIVRIESARPRSQASTGP